MAVRWGTSGQQSIGHGGKVRGRSVQSTGNGYKNVGSREVWRPVGGPGRKVPHKAPDQDPPKKSKINYKQNYFAS